MEAPAARWAAPAATTLLAVLGAVLAGAPASALAGAAAVAVLMGALGASSVSGWARVLPVAAAVALFPVACGAAAGNIGLFGTCVLAAWVGLADDRRAVAAVVAAATAVFAVAWLMPSDDGWGAWVAGVAVSGAAGAAGRRQRELLAEVRAAQAGLAEQARSEERNRIAHELHDVIGHALTVSVLQLSGARLTLEEHPGAPAEVDAALEEAERLTRQSLAEVRAVVGLMRDPGPARPLPGVADLADLVSGFRSAGADLDWQIEGDPSVLTATEALTVYRILQEALTNAARHAPGRRTTARLTVVDGVRTVVVANAAPAIAPGDVREGGGLAGMRARAEALGGRVSAGPHRAGPGHTGAGDTGSCDTGAGDTGSCWRVEAVLPG